MPEPGPPPAPRKISPQHHLEWWLLKRATTWVQGGSFEEASRKARVLARLGRHLLRSEWRWATLNPRLIYGPALTDDALRKLAGLAFENVFLSHLEGMRVRDVRLLDDGLEHLREAYALGRGVIVAGVHLGCWEPGLRHLGETGLPCAVVYRQANNPLSEELFCQFRQDHGVEWISRRDPRQTLRTLEERKVLGLMVDINTRRKGVVAPYLGLPAMSPPGPARLAIRFRCPVVPVVATREESGLATFRVGKPIEPPLQGKGNALESSLTTTINSAFEGWIHTYAEQYNWLHARWRTRPDGTLWRPSEPWQTLARSRTEPFRPLSERIRKILA
ncbi:MAG: lysophospholipid acyltransferase family protein [Magnetococcales bacterium]|nr:lysophospholipid acyltransferase family protein [Magnetococcales bacterium]